MARVAAGVITPAEQMLPTAAERPPATSLYLTLLNWAFVVVSTTRLVTYLPTLWAIHATGDSRPYSLWTWCAWVASNAVMAAWLFEHNRRRTNMAIVVMIGNALMCTATCVLIVWYR